MKLTPTSALNRPLAYRARVTCPPRATDILRRPRLLNLLHEHRNKQLLLVCAAAGYGKTTLLTDFMHETDYAAGWLQCTEREADLSGLLAALIQALHTALSYFEPSVPDWAAEINRRPQEVAAWLGHEIELQADEPVLLVLDDFQVIQRVPAVQVFFDALLARRPQPLHLVIGSRALPDFHYIALRIHQQVIGLDEKDLRFTADEVQALLPLRQQLALPPLAAEQLVMATEGWITGILLSSQLVWPGLLGTQLTASYPDNAVYEYLATEILEQQPAGLRQFLLESALLPELDGPRCDAILERTDSQACLSAIEAQRLFITRVGDEVRVYHYHHLFREFLVAQLEQRAPARRRAVLNRAGQWYADQARFETAITCFNLAEQSAWAMRLIEDQARRVFFEGRQQLLLTWAHDFAAEAADLPRLHYYLALTASDEGDTEKAAHALTVARSGFARQADAGGELDVAALDSWLAYRRGEFETALRLAQACEARAVAGHQTQAQTAALRCSGLARLALGQLPEAEGALKTALAVMAAEHLPNDRAATLIDLGSALHLQGKTTEAVVAQQQALAVHRERRVPGPLATSLNNLGWLTHMLGQPEQAEVLYQEALGWAQRAGHTRLIAVVQAGRADIQLDYGADEAAAELWRDAIRHAEAVQAWSVMAYSYRGLARLAWRQRHWLGALDWLNQAAALPHQAQLSPLSNLASLRGAILADMGQIATGRSLLATVCDDLAERGASADLAQAWLYAAFAAFRDQDGASTQTLLERALAVSDRVGYDQMLLADAPALADLFTALAAAPRIGPRLTALMGRLAAVRRVVSDQLRPMSIRADCPPQFQIQTLGQVRIFKNQIEQPATIWKARGARDFWLYLIDQSPVMRERVLTTFWPDLPADRATANLNQTLLRVRQALDHRVVNQAAGVFSLLDASQVDCDAARFEAQVRVALKRVSGDPVRLAQLSEAAELYRGEYLPDVFADWALTRRATLRELYVKTLEAQVDEHLLFVQYEAARQRLMIAIQLEPYRDNLQIKLLTCLDRLGWQHAVIDHYQRYCATLRQELGLDPSPELRTVYAEIIR